MEVKRGVARTVCARSAQDGIVVPSNSRSNILTTHDADNTDSTAQGDFSMSEFHGYTLSVTNQRGSRKVQLLRLSSGGSYLTAHGIDLWPSD